MKIIIAGGGIGGLTAGISLTLQGHDVHVLEQASEIGEVGAGVQISSNGIKILNDLGVMPGLEAAVFEPDAIEMRMGATGKQVFYLPMKGVATARWGERHLQVYRPDLIEALRARLCEVSPNVLTTGARVAQYAQDENSVTVTLETGERLSADLLVAADGVRSRVRNQMFGGDAPVYTGNTAWRAVVPADRLGELVPPPTGCIWAGDRKHAVTTRMRKGNLINFVGIVETENPLHDDQPGRDGWRQSGTQAQALQDFGSWSPVITRIIEEAGDMFRWPLYGRAPLSRWSDGRVVLLGDAAHPMLPSMAQGAVAAFEDAVVLTRVLSDVGSGTDDVASACQRYFKARITRATRVQEVSAANLRIFHTQSGLKRAVSFSAAGLAGRFAPEVLYRRYDWLYGATV
ncbi:FAD-dependent monooxygenase [Halocynthiibacter namhaensis]|uniref:FAD-dependent monooxygenase n=1 Tax=Halocynthiibacter namhaensis TaxID=1290553 RepID=UPI0005799126|nr:FAD-dependent monooxygenase [Halocynthiibacter namhaensis]